MDVLQKVEYSFEKFKGQKFTIGKSLNGQPIYCFCVAKSSRPRIIFGYAIHAREHITSHLALKHIRYFNAFGKRGTVYFLPVLNPDGVQIALTRDPLYKANARGVDLNVNFDAKWGSGKSNVQVKGSANYVGTHPFSEPETIALRDFTLSIKPDMTVSYHCKGEEIYYEFFQTGSRLERDFKFAKTVSFVTGYAIKTPVGSAGGYKDWCVQNLSIPSLTIEVGSDQLSHPITEEYLPNIYQKNKGVVRALTESCLWNTYL